MSEVLTSKQKSHFAQSDAAFIAWAEEEVDGRRVHSD